MDAPWDSLIRQAQSLYISSHQEREAVWVVEVELVSSSSTSLVCVRFSKLTNMQPGRAHCFLNLSKHKTAPLGKHFPPGFHRLQPASSFRAVMYVIHAGTDLAFLFSHAGQVSGGTQHRSKRSSAPRAS